MIPATAFLHNTKILVLELVPLLKIESTFHETTPLSSLTIEWMLRELRCLNLTKVIYSLVKIICPYLITNVGSTRPESTAK